MAIDPWALIAGALCVAGLATALAAISYYAWLASERGVTRRVVLGSPPFLTVWSLGMFAAALGWALLRRDHPWEVAVALVVAVSYAVDLAMLARRARRS